MKRNTLTVVMLLTAAIAGNAQQMNAAKMQRMRDSVKAVYLDLAALKNPIIRQAGISYDVAGTGNMKSNLNGNPFLRGRMQIARTTAFFNVPVAHFGKNIVSANFAARRQTFDLSHVQTNDPAVTVDDREVDKTTVGGTITITRMDSLFNVPVTYSVSASALVDTDTWQDRFVFSGVIAFTLKRTPQTSISVGTLLLLDPTAPLPIIPFFSYQHRFKNPSLEFFFDPSRIAFRKELSPRHFLWLSNNISPNLVMLEMEQGSLPARSVFTTLDLRSGLTYEYRITRKTVLGLSAGVSSTLSSKILEHNKNQDPFIKNTQNIVPYAQVSISCLPFWKGLVGR